MTKYSLKLGVALGLFVAVGCASKKDQIAGEGFAPTEDTTTASAPVESTTVAQNDVPADTNLGAASSGRAR